MRLENIRHRKKNHRLYFKNIKYGKRANRSNLKNICKKNYMGAWITCPNVFALHTDSCRNQLVKMLSDIKRTKSKIDFRNVELLLPSGFIYFLSFLHYNSLCINNLVGRRSKTNTVREMLNFIESSYSSGKRAQLEESKNHMVSRWRFYHGTSATFPDDYEEVECFIQNHTKSHDDFLSINSAISEAVTNVINHAYDKKNERRWWMFVGLNKTDNRLAVVICDQGQSIPVTVPLNASERVKRLFLSTNNEDNELIKIATIARRTRTGLSHRGKGLKQILDISKSIPDAQVNIFSRRGQCAFGSDDDNANTRDFSIPINGTIISWLLPLNGDQ